MRGALLVARRELLERRNVFLAAVAASVLPFAAALAPWVGVADGGEARDIVAITLALAFAAGIALVYGATMIGRDLAERRLGFYFSRPLSGLAIWGGKMLAGCVLLVLPPVLVLLPSALAGKAGGLLSVLRDGTATAATVLGGTFLLALAHAAGVAVRSRSVWLAADVAALAFTGTATWLAARTLMVEGALRPLTWLVASIVALAFASLIAAGAVQVCSGRTDLRRGHRALSLTTWGVLLPAAALAVTFSRWVVNVTPAHLEAVTEVASAPYGDAVVIGGPARFRGGYHSAFLLDPRTGRSVRIAPSAFAGWTTFSADGQAVIAVARDRESKRPFTEIVIGRIGHAGPALVRTPLVFPGAWVRVAASPSAARIATITDDALSVWDTASGALLASFRLEDASGIVRPVFVSERVLRVYRFVHVGEDRDTGAVVIEEFDVAARSGRLAGTIAGAHRFDLVVARIDGSHERLLWRSRTDDGALIALVDARTGMRIAGLGSEASTDSVSAGFLPDGGVVVGAIRRGKACLRVHDPAGRLRLNVNLGDAARVLIGASPAPETILVGISTRTPVEVAATRTELIDLTTGARRAIGERMVPVAALGWWWMGTDPKPGSFGSRACRTASGALVEVDPSNGEQRIVVAGQSAPDNTL